jgi:hypothetical protein
MAAEGICNICGSLAEYGSDAAFPSRHCPRCGDFDYDASLGWLQTQSPDEMVRVSGWVREQNAAGIVPVRITPEILRRVSNMPLPGFRDRALRLLSIIVEALQQNLDAWFAPVIEADKVELQGVSYSKNAPEVLVLFKILIEEGLLDDDAGNCCLSVKGLLAAEALRARGSGSKVSSPCGLTTL